MTPMLWLRSRPDSLKPLRLFLLVGLASSCPALAQDPVVLFPHNYSVAFENSLVQVVKVHYGPHEKLGVHDHSKTTTVYVYLSDAGRVRFNHVGEGSHTLTRATVTLGEFRVSPGNVESHSVENLGDQSSDFLRVELKQVPIRTLNSFLHAKPPDHLLKSATTMEFEEPAVQVQRVVCISGSVCELTVPKAPSLLIALSPSSLAEGNSEATPTKLAKSDLRWLQAGQKAWVRAASTSAAHLIRIIVPGKD